MKYLVNRKTKEHTVATREDMMLVKEFGLNSDVFALVEADSEGWIPHTGTVCPLPDDARCDAQGHDKTDKYSGPCENIIWSCVKRYRPILTEQAEPVQEPDYDPRSVSFNLLDRLKAAHKAAQTIPDLEAELREVLGSMGYDLVARSPFVEPEPAVETLQDFSAVVAAEGLDDWRNWREGDWIKCVDAEHGPGLSDGDILHLMTVYEDAELVRVKLSAFESSLFDPVRFSFHSRPAKGEK